MRAAEPFEESKALLFILWLPGVIINLLRRRLSARFLLGSRTLTGGGFTPDFSTDQCEDPLDVPNVWDADHIGRL